jgi:hypothetical protein
MRHSLDRFCLNLSKVKRGLGPAHTAVIPLTALDKYQRFVQPARSL